MADGPQMAKLALYQKTLESSDSLEVSQLEIAFYTRMLDTFTSIADGGAIAIAQPLTITSTDASALDVGGGINTGTGNVALVGTDGRINGPLSSTIIDDLSGANLTGLSASNISSGTLGVANGGTGASSLTDGGVLLGSGTDAITATAVLGDGEILIGDANGDPATLDVGSASAITILGTVATGAWQGTAIANAYVADDLTISGGTVNGSVIGGSSAAAGSFTTLTASSTGAASLDVGGGINAGTGNVSLVGTDGKIEGPLSSTIIDDLSGANLTTLNASNLSSGTAGTARLGSGTASSSTFLRGDSSWATPAGGELNPTTQVFTSGSGTYTTPDNCKTLRVRIVGGGGGAGAASTNAGAAGGNTTFAASSMQGTGGGAGGHGASTGGAGGTGGAGANGLVNVRGSDGTGGGDDTAAPGGYGGASYFGGAGAGGVYTAAGVNAGGVGSGGGGAGATNGATNSSGGGGAGGYCERLVDDPDETYAYAVGAGGSGGAAGTDAGGNGSAGIVIVEEFYA